MTNVARPDLYRCNAVRYVPVFTRKRMFPRSRYNSLWGKAGQARAPVQARSFVHRMPQRSSLLTLCQSTVLGVAARKLTPPNIWGPGLSRPLSPYAFTIPNLFAGSWANGPSQASLFPLFPGNKGVDLRRPTLFAAAASIC